MKFFFPDSQDLVSPSYDFLRDEYAAHRVRQRDDRYAHEVLDRAPYDGILVSKSIVDGSIKGAGKYSTAQRARLHRMGVHRFFRLPLGSRPSATTAHSTTSMRRFLRSPRPKRSTSTRSAASMPALAPTTSSLDSPKTPRMTM